MTGLTRISDTDIAALRRSVPRAFGRPLAARLRRAVGWVAFGGVLTVSLWRMDVSAQRIWQGFGKLGWLLPFMFPPTHGGWLAHRIRVNNWDEACFILIMILITVTVIDLLSKAIRLRIINAGEPI